MKIYAVIIFSLLFIFPAQAMKLLVNVKTGNISAAFSDMVSGNKKQEVIEPQIPTGFKIVDFPGNSETYLWPHPNGPSACVFKANKIIANPDVPVPPQ